MKPISFSYLLAFVIMIIFTPTLQATKIVHMNPEKLAEVSTTVVRGTVTTVQSYWNPSGSKVFTETTIAVEESYKGTPGSVVHLLQLGGEVDGIRVTVHGALHWAPGEEVVVFLEPYQAGSYHVAGFSQGKFKVERDPITGRAFINRPNLQGLELVDDDGEKHSPKATDFQVPLERFLSMALGTDYAPSNR